MSQLGNIQTTYGKSFSIAVANTTAENISYSSNLPKNTIIISAPCDKSTYEDINGAALLVTDNNGEPILLSKSLIEGSGLLYKNDKIMLSIDNNTIRTNENGELFIDIDSIIDKSTEIKTNSNGKLEIDEDFIQKISGNKFGVAKVDGKTILAKNGIIYVATENLDYATNELYGIVKGDGKTIKFVNGVPNIIQNGLINISSTTYGLATVDNTTLVSNDGTISVNESSLIANDEIGLIKVDGTTISSSNGTLQANIDELPKASESVYGTIKVNQSQFNVYEDGSLEVISISELSETTNNLQTRIQHANDELDNIEKEISSL